MSAAVEEPFSLGPINDLLAAHDALSSRVRASQRRHRRQIASLPSPPETLLSLPLIPSPSVSPSSSRSTSPEPSEPAPSQVRTDLPPVKRLRAQRYPNYVPEEETLRNDYNQHYVDSGEWPQDWVLGADSEKRFEEYPKQQRLLALKKASVAASASPPAYLPLASLDSLQPSKFDVILIDPPYSSSFSWDTLAALPIPALAADPSFIFLWVGSGAGEGLERGREVLANWRYRRCEDVVWVKTNKTTNSGPGTDPPTTSLLTRTKQHCLMGIKGTVRRSTDSWFVHCNVDTDVMIWEGDPSDPTRKPPETYTLIENFCLGTRRLELFGRAHSLRPGWVTVGDIDLTPEEAEGTGARLWERDWWEADVKQEGGRHVVSTTAEIEMLRPKSPIRGNTANLNHAPPPQATQMSAPRGNTSLGFPGPGFNPMMNQVPVMMPQPYNGMPMPMGVNMGQPGFNMPFDQSMPFGGPGVGPSWGVDPSAMGMGMGFPQQGMQGNAFGGMNMNMGMGMNPMANTWNGGNTGNMNMNMNMNMGMGMGGNGMPWNGMDPNGGMGWNG